jgi:hypothetical protein
MRTRNRRPRCAWVLAILDNRMETVELLREEIHPPTGDFVDGSLEIAVVRWRELEVSIPLNSVVFLYGQHDR